MSRAGSAAGVCPRTARKWVDRFKADRLAGLADRSSRPQRLRQPTSPAVVDQVIALRRRRLPGQHKAFAFNRACRRLRLKHIRTRLYTPKTNGKAERFIQTALREWAYARPYPTSAERAQQLQPWTHAYNWHRPHGSLKAKTPISRLRLSEDNLLRLHI